jgi:phosphatidylglycerol:prolipoprotein diacylglycerol transferase
MVAGDTIRRFASPPGGLALFLLAFAGLFGARLHFVLAHPGLFSSVGRVIAVWDGGLHSPGAVVGLIAMSLVVTRVATLPLGHLLDALAPASALALAIHRIGCFLRGCCLGSVCDYAWCVRYPRRSAAFLLHAHTGVITGTEGASAPVHPLPLYFLTLALVIMALGLWRLRRRRYPGEVMLLTVLCFGVGRWWLESYRAVTEGTVFLWGWPQLTLVAASIAGGAFVLLLVAEALWRRGGKVFGTT